MLGLGARADAHEEFAAPVADGSVEPEGVAQIRVAPLVEGSREADPRLDPDECALPGESHVTRISMRSSGRS
jgi:hypothetical protein